MKLKDWHWITKWNDAFGGYIPLAADKKLDKDARSFFVVHSRGFETARDMWVYNYSHNTVSTKMRNMVEFYNEQIGKGEPSYDAVKISWSSSLLGHLEKVRAATYKADKITGALYRPFVKQHVYTGEMMIHRRGQFNEFFPTPAHSAGGGASLHELTQAAPAVFEDEEPANEI